jgi:hypothetical protein
MRWVLYSVLALANAATLSARAERAAFMPRPETLELVALWLPLVGLATLVALGFRRAPVDRGGELSALALVSALGCLVLALVPGIQ